MILEIVGLGPCFARLACPLVSGNADASQSQMDSAQITQHRCHLLTAPHLLLTIDERRSAYRFLDKVAIEVWLWIV